MTTDNSVQILDLSHVVEAYRLDRYDNNNITAILLTKDVVEAYRLDRYDNTTQLRFEPSSQL